MKDRKYLKGYLKRGDLQDIAEKSGVGITVITRYLNGEIEHSIVSEYINALIEERKLHAKRVAREIVDKTNKNQ